MAFSQFAVALRGDFRDSLAACQGSVAVCGGSLAVLGGSLAVRGGSWRFPGGLSGLPGLHNFMNSNVGLIVFTRFLTCQFAWLYTLAVRWRFAGGSLAVPWRFLAVPGGSWRFPGGSWRFLAVPWHLPMAAGFDSKGFHTPNRSQPNDQ